MKKKVILLLLLLIVIAACFIPVDVQKTVTIKAPLLNVYQQLSDPLNWEKWRPDIKTIFTADSNKVYIQKASISSLRIKYPGQDLNVITNENLFSVTDSAENKKINYSYTVLPDQLQTTVLEKRPKKTLVTANKKISLLNYLMGTFRPVSFS